MSFSHAKYTYLLQNSPNLILLWHQVENLTIQIRSKCNQGLLGATALNLKHYEQTGQVFYSSHTPHTIGGKNRKTAIQTPTWKGWKWKAHSISWSMAIFKYSQAHGASFFTMAHFCFLEILCGSYLYPLCSKRCSLQYIFSLKEMTQVCRWVSFSACFLSIKVWGFWGIFSFWIVSIF